MAAGACSRPGQGGRLWEILAKRRMGELLAETVKPGNPQFSVVMVKAPSLHGGISRFDSGWALPFSVLKSPRIEWGRINFNSEPGNLLGDPYHIAL